MHTNKKPLSIKVIYWVTNITFWIYVAASVILLFIVAALMFNIFGDLQLHVGVPVAINVLEHGILEVNDNTINLKFVEMYGKVHFIDSPAFVGRVYGVFVLAIVSLFFYIFLIFKKFINSVYDGMYFNMKNISLLKRISYALVGVWAFTAFYATFQYFFLVKNLEFTTIETTGNVQTYPVILLVALFIWVLSHIFVKGCELQEENQYTI